MKLDLLVVAAHPDDAEICVGGTMLLASRAGKRVGVIDLTRGELGTRGSAEEREREARQASELLGLSVRHNLGLPDGRVQVTLEAREALARRLRELAPDVVLAHHLDDHHPDHAAAAKLAREAWYLAGLARLAAQDGSAPAARARRLLSFMGHVAFEPTLVVDISPVWESKLELVRCYASQLTPAHAGDRGQHFLSGGDILRRVETRARTFGERIGVRHGEPLLSMGPLACADPAGWLMA